MNLRIKIILLFLSISLLIGLSVVLAQDTSGLTTELQSFSALNNSQKDTILGSMGLPSASSFSLAKIVACLIFNGIGFVAFVYGKKEKIFPPLVTGIALMGYPYFVNDTFWLFVIGLGLTALLYFWRD